MLKHSTLAVLFATIAGTVSATAATQLNPSQMTFPYYIYASGSYELTGDATLRANTNGIVVVANNVTLDLGGYTLSCSGCSGAAGIYVQGRHAVIRNGRITGFNTGPLSQNGQNPSAGILVTGDEAQIQHIDAFQNWDGVAVTGQIEVDVTDSSLGQNSGHGISCLTCLLSVLNSRVSQNGSDGLVMGSGFVTATRIWGNHGVGLLIAGPQTGDVGSQVTNTLMVANGAGSAVGSTTNQGVGFGLVTIMGGAGLGTGSVGMSGAGACYGNGLATSPWRAAIGDWDTIDTCPEKQWGNGSFTGILGTIIGSLVP